MHNFTKPDGCRAQMLACQDKLKERGMFAANARAMSESDACDDIEPWCESAAEMTYMSMDRSWFDIGHPSADPFPPPQYAGYIMQGSVLEALGVPVNFSWVSPAVSESFSGTRDELLGGFLDATGYLLDHGVKVHMMYGDRDYACNWVGGERVSLEVPYARSADFAAAGYAPLLTTQGVKGMTRQHGNYSFTRVFQAGHEVPSYQPEAAYEIFMRATFNRDVATGLLPVTSELATVGPSDTWHIKNDLPEEPTPQCYILSPGTCRPEIWEKVWAGKVRVEDYFVVGVDEDDGDEEDWVIVDKDGDDGQVPSDEL
jgi:carboxypeptidase C (cathepsin A)